MNDDYEMLKSFGFSPAKASEVLLDVKRGDTTAFMWLQVARAAHAARSPQGSTDAP